jgi:Tfp pilus assembly protein PilO
MTKRERTLTLATSVTIACVVLFYGFTMYSEAMSRRNEQLQSAEKKLAELDAKDLQVKKLEAMRRDWQKLSLPTDPKTASNSFQSWLTKTAESAKLQKIQINGRILAGSKNNFDKLSCTLDAVGSMEQLGQFLHSFASMNRLQEIRSLTLTPKDNKDKSGDVTIRMTVEALILKGTTNTEMPNTIATGFKDEKGAVIDGSKVAKSLAARNFFADYKAPPPVEDKRPKEVVRAPDPPPKFDASKTIIVTGLTNGPDGAQAWITYRLKDQTIKPFEGDIFEVEGNKIEVVRINHKDVEFKLGDKKFTVEYGQSLADGLKGKADGSKAKPGPL